MEQEGRSHLDGRGGREVEAVELGVSFPTEDNVIEKAEVTHSTPQTPGNLPSPNSATDWLMPNHLNLPGAEVGPGAEPVLVVVARVVVGDPPPVPGKHCYHHPESVIS